MTDVHADVGVCLKGAWASVGFPKGEILCISYGYGENHGSILIRVRFASYSDVRVGARLIFIIGVGIGDINADAEGSG
ncbi:Acid Sphingomyelinase-Like Phosphodiesterase 3A [Manis pentadactyla]|nr:Acid Sphingomyelinase-Like Phosphodiesterase 3A [Manis pentadactyla]